MEMMVKIEESVAYRWCLKPNKPMKKGEVQAHTAAGLEASISQSMPGRSGKKSLPKPNIPPGRLSNSV